MYLNRSIPVTPSAAFEAPGECDKIMIEAPGSRAWRTIRKKGAGNSFYSPKEWSKTYRRIRENPRFLPPQCRLL
jgi:hypothetical protein